MSNSDDASTTPVVKLPKCQGCGRRWFTLGFTLGRTRYCVVAKCVRCGRRRPTGLDTAHAAVTRARKRDGPADESG